MDKTYVSHDKKHVAAAMAARGVARFPIASAGLTGATLVGMRWRHWEEGVNIP